MGSTEQSAMPETKSPAAAAPDLSPPSSPALAPAPAFTAHSPDDGPLGNQSPGLGGGNDWLAPSSNQASVSPDVEGFQTLTKPKTPQPASGDPSQSENNRWATQQLEKMAKEKSKPTVQPVGSQEDYKTDFRKSPVTAQAVADEIVACKDPLDWSCTENQKVMTAPGYFKDGHPKNDILRPKVDQWFKNTFPGTVDLSGGQSAKAVADSDPDSRRKVDDHINAGKGLRPAATGAAGAVYDDSNPPTFAETIKRQTGYDVAPAVHRPDRDPQVQVHQAGGRERKKALREMHRTEQVTPEQRRRLRQAFSDSPEQQQLIDQWADLETKTERDRFLSEQGNRLRQPPRTPAEKALGDFYGEALGGGLGRRRPEKGPGAPRPGDPGKAIGGPRAKGWDDYRDTVAHRADKAFREEAQKHARHIRTPYGFIADNAKPADSRKLRREGVKTIEMEGGKKVYLKWDDNHGGEWEMYLPKGKFLRHQGVLDPVTGQQIKPPDPEKKPIRMSDTGDDNTSFA
ncbi:colicin E3/pyocin S6 family cytotoxin [Magnetospira sp. QH-2]|uniref:colicin E3/pyocin S6 family cytotoxin n=1 Tax=Magnetospira sp. (strain QH-2) TaxID=1288970 RepID=UPI0003E8173D|nr:colicin E3/pyocin S6 family cytotoxin [Magnetospira sp. QH-2]CCQ72309.1 protein of unknown function [Magnetospira sp. QH-2]